MEYPWEQYIKLDEQLQGSQRELVIRSLNEIWSTPEGRDLIMRAPRDGSAVNIRSVNNYDYSSEAGPNYIGLDFEGIARNQYATANGDWRYGSVTEILVHELFHNGDRARNAPKPSGTDLIEGRITTVPATGVNLQDIYATVFLYATSEMGSEGAAEFDRDSRRLINLGDLEFKASHFMQNNTSYITRMAEEMNRLAADPELLAEIAQHHGLESISISHADIATVLATTRHQLEFFEESRFLRRQREEMATDFTDYFMLRYFGIEPRENYLTFRIADARSNVANLPTMLNRPLENDAVLEEAREYLIGGGEHVHEGSLGRLDLPMLPDAVIEQVQPRR